MAERGLTVDHSTIARWVLRYAPVLNERIRSEMRNPNRSWRVDETYVRVAGQWTYLYRFIPGHRFRREHDRVPAFAIPRRHYGESLSPACDCTGRPHSASGHRCGRHPAYPTAVADLKRSGESGRRCRCRRSPYMNNIFEQDHRFVKKRVVESQWFRSVDGALITIAGYEAINMILLWCKLDLRQIRPLSLD